MQEPLSITIGQYSDQGAKDRNDDSYGVLVPEGALLDNKGIAAAIADGLSVSQAAKEASETCIKSFLADYYDAPASWAARTAASRVLSATNRWLNGQSLARFGSDLDMASTFSGLVLKGGTAFIFHVGDSRIALLRGGVLEPLTQAHKISSEAGREFLSRAMGAGTHLDVDYRTLALETGDIFFFSTDGLHDYVSDDEVARCIEASDGDFDKAAQELVEQALAEGSPDNVTCQIICVDAVGTRDEDAFHKTLTELPFPPDLEAGMRLDGYRIIRELHLSPRSQVYLAVDDETGDKLVLKTPSVNYRDDPVFLECFSREEWVGQTVTSPHVARTIVPKRQRQFLYTLVEYVEGQTLGQWMADNPSPELNAVRDIVDQIIVGVRALHRKEIIHQDLKPDNIMIDRDGTVKIVDFGSVRILGLEEAAPEFAPEHAMGTVGYVAPELVNGSRANQQSDLYAIAAITYEMLTGELPYRRGFQSARQVKKAAYQSLRQVRPDVPTWVDGALEKAVSKDPATRQAALSELAVDLRKANVNFTSTDRPFIEKNPIAFWQTVSCLLFLALLLALWTR
ncbi:MULTISPECIES: bifunctional protein-serine/threonine kinase/phosphatase [Kordiimonas]|uniref:bifunctional protein-serine/threonine kinase/phosphatase n=1 Tax=Kordiimonas TaxID=288021 RepID=UPI00257D85A6|nr:bifunctional protein-serine/threonine kinase/phosphatase [Kordiimonas sp. UBA4487]